MPRDPEHLHPEIITNPLLVQVTAAILGKDVHSAFYNGNTNMPGSVEQPLHRDSRDLELNKLPVTTAVVINISPVDFDETNGATEIWPGTHRIPGPSAVTAEAEAERRTIRPPARAITRKGDAVLRDIRLWHRGVPNHSAAARHMIGMIHCRPSYLPGMSIRVPKAAVPAFDCDGLTTRVEVVDDDHDYLAETVKT